MRGLGDNRLPADTSNTTRDRHSSGDPRLIASLGENMTIEDPRDSGPIPRVFHLLPGVTTIGSHSDADVLLPGLAARHAEIRRDEADEYHFVDLSNAGTNHVDGATPTGKPLRTGDRLNIGGWVMSYFRDEFAHDAKV